MKAMTAALLDLTWMHPHRRPEIEIVVSNLSAEDRAQFISRCQKAHDQSAGWDAARRANGYPFKEAQARREADTASMAASIASMRTITGPLAPMPEKWAQECAA